VNTPTVQDQHGDLTFSSTARSDTLVFAPTLNEYDSISKFIDGILSLSLRLDVLIVDDRSDDGTTEYLLKRSRTEPRLNVIVRSGKLGIGSAHRVAWSYARDNNYARIVTLDADLSHDPCDIPRLLAMLDAGSDVAVGSRFAAGGRLDYTGWRRVLSVGGNRLAGVLLGLPLTEYTTSFRAARLSAVPIGLVESIYNNDYAFFLSCVVAFARAGLRITEVPIRFYNRHGGASKMPRLAIAAGVFNLLWLAIDRRAFAGRGLTLASGKQLVERL
jgi:dolichol-phosphate mannosyltransferase